MITQDLVKEALKTVYDPELGVDIVNLGMVYDVSLKDEGKTVEVTMTLTTMGCPLYDEIHDEIQNKVKEIQGVQVVTVNLTFTPAWTPEFMSDEAKLLFKYMF